MFSRRMGGKTVGVSLEEGETSLLRALIGEYLEFLDAHDDPTDPAPGRLFPPASDDAEIDAEFREMTGDDLKDHKRKTAGTAQSLLPLDGRWRTEFEQDEAEAWAMLLTDLRLVIGERVGVTEEMMESLPDPNDESQYPLALLHYLGALQESLIRAIEPEPAN